MSFLSGIMMGASLGSTIHDALTGSTINEALTGSSGAGTGSRTGCCAAAWAGVCAYPLCQKLERYWQFPEQSGAPAYRQQL